MATSVQTSITFTATAQSVVTWGRSITTQEGADLQAKRGAMVAAGKFGAFARQPGTTTSTFLWVNLEAAQEWVAYCNTFTPPPESAVASDIPDTVAE